MQDSLKGYILHKLLCILNERDNAVGIPDGVSNAGNNLRARSSAKLSN